MKMNIDIHVPCSVAGLCPSRRPRFSFFLSFCSCPAIQQLADGSSRHPIFYLYFHWLHACSLSFSSFNPLDPPGLAEGQTSVLLVEDDGPGLEEGQISVELWCAGEGGHISVLEAWGALKSALDVVNCGLAWKERNGAGIILDGL